MLVCRKTSAVCFVLMNYFQVKEDCDLVLIICSSGYCLNAPQGESLTERHVTCKQQISFQSEQQQLDVSFCRGQQANPGRSFAVHQLSFFRPCEKVFSLHAAWLNYPQSQSVDSSCSARVSSGSGDNQQGGCGERKPSGRRG